MLYQDLHDRALPRGQGLQNRIQLTANLDFFQGPDSIYWLRGILGLNAGQMIALKIRKKKNAM